MQVDGYAGWNTSANTLGTALAMAVDSFLFGKSSQHFDFLAERYVEDALYCSIVRSEVTKMLPEGMNYFDVHESDGKAAMLVRSALGEKLNTVLGSIASNVQICEVHMPWRRMFEVSLQVRYTAS